jgi:hypothetical protein
MSDNSENGSANGVTDTTGFDLDTAPDISELEEQGAVVHIRNAKGEKMYDAGQPVTMTVRGSYSKTYRRLSTAQRDQLLRQRRSTLTAEQLDKNDVALVAACVTDWQGFKASGAPIPFSKEAVIKVFTRFPYVLEQIKEEMSARENFTERSSPPSATT